MPRFLPAGGAALPRARATTGTGGSAPTASPPSTAAAVTGTASMPATSRPRPAVLRGGVRHPARLHGRAARPPASRRSAPMTLVWRTPSSWWSPITARSWPRTAASVTATPSRTRCSTCPGSWRARASAPARWSSAADRERRRPAHAAGASRRAAPRRYAGRRPGPARRRRHGLPVVRQGSPPSTPGRTTRASAAGAISCAENLPGLLPRALRRRRAQRFAVDGDGERLAPVPPARGAGLRRPSPRRLDGPRRAVPRQPLWPADVALRRCARSSGAWTATRGRMRRRSSERHPGLGTAGTGLAGCDRARPGPAGPRRRAPGPGCSGGRARRRLRRRAGHDAGGAHAVAVRLRALAQGELRRRTATPSCRSAPRRPGRAGCASSSPPESAQRPAHRRPARHARGRRPPLPAAPRRRGAAPSAAGARLRPVSDAARTPGRARRSSLHG